MAHRSSKLAAMKLAEDRLIRLEDADKVAAIIDNIADLSKNEREMIHQTNRASLAEAEVRAQKRKNEVLQKVVTRLSESCDDDAKAYARGQGVL